MTSKDRFFSGKFDPEKLEAAINSYAAQGWRVVSVATASIPAFGGTRSPIFRYGQKAHPRWELVLTVQWDTESWYGSRDVVAAS